MTENPIGCSRSVRAAPGLGVCSRRTFLSAVAGMVPTVTVQHHPATPEPERNHYSRRVFPPAQADVEGVRHEVWTRHPTGGRGPDVIVLHEITGATESFFEYTDTLVGAGFSVHCPVFFGPAFVKPWWFRDFISAIQACHPGSEFRCTARSAHKALNAWLVELARDISGPTRRPLGAIGMCLTGIQPLSMLRCRAVIAPVLCQPTLPVGFGAASARDLALPPSDLDLALARVACEDLRILLMRYAQDRISRPEKADRLRALFGSHLISVAIPGEEHSSLVHDPDPAGLARRSVVDFLRAQFARAAAQPQTGVDPCRRP